MPAGFEIMVHTEERIRASFRENFRRGGSISFELEERRFVLFFPDRKYAERLAKAMNEAAEDPDILRAVRSAHEALDQLPCDTEPASDEWIDKMSNGLRLVPTGGERA